VLKRSSWTEWYDVPELLAMFAPPDFDVILSPEFQNGDFNWFDLLHHGK
jgi:hypothetical protein